MSNHFAMPARRPRLKRIVLTGMLLAAASVAVLVFGQAAFTSSAAAASIRTASVARIASVARDSRAEVSALRAIVGEKQAAQAAADAAAAKAAAAAAAAQAAAAQAAANAATARAAAVARAAAASAGTVNVWTSGWQSEINACRGGVDITAHYGTPTVAQHWGCGGSSFPTSAGAIVQFTGLDAGTYRVIGIVAILNAYTATTNQLPHGYQMLFQTCRNNDSHTTEFVALEKIG